MWRRSNFHQFSLRFRKRLLSLSFSGPSWAHVTLHCIYTIPLNSWETWERGCPSHSLILCTLYISCTLCLPLTFWNGCRPLSDIGHLIGGKMGKTGKHKHKSHKTSHKSDKADKEDLKEGKGSRKNQHKREDREGYLEPFALFSCFMWFVCIVQKRQSVHWPHNSSIDTTTVPWPHK